MMRRFSIFYIFAVTITIVTLEVTSAYGQSPDPTNGVLNNRIHGTYVGCLLNNLDLERQVFVVSEKPPGKLRVPYAEFRSPTGYEARTSQSRPYFTTTFLHGSEAPLDDQLEVVQFASKWFKRRSWSDEFLDTRGPLVKAYAPRSIYVREESISYEELMAREKKPQIDGTIGLTYAREGELLPMEETLQKQVTRYQDSHGKSLIVELRSYAKDPKGYHTLGPRLLNDMLSITLASVRGYPELYEKPIIYTYGDKTSLRMYRSLGFEVQTHLTPLEQPIPYKGTDWWIIAVSPKRFEQNFFTTGGEREVYDLNQPFPVTLPNGIKSWAAPGTHISIEKNETVSYFISNEEVEIRPGLFAAPHSRFRFYHDSLVTSGDNFGPIRISHASEETGIPPGAEISAAAGTIYLKDPGGPLAGLRVTLHGKPMSIPKYGITVNEEARFATLSGELTEAKGLTQEVEIAPGLVAAKGSSMRFAKVRGNSHEHCYKLTLAKSFEHAGILHPAGSRIQIGWKDDAVFEVKAEDPK